jgi:hypothetical protein
LNMEAIHTRYFGESKKFFGSAKRKVFNRNVQSCRDDYFSCQLCNAANENFAVTVGTAWIKNVRQVYLSCNDHNGGTCEKYFHLPFQPMVLPSGLSDQLSHAVLNCRVLKPSQAHAYSDSYQLNETRGSYAGIDTCMISESRRFDIASTIGEFHMSTSLKSRPDIKGLLMRLQENNFVERQSAQAWLERAGILFPDRASIDRLEELSTGGTLMTLTDCIKLQEGLCEPASTTIDCTRTGGLFRLEFQPNWPRSLVYVHSHTKHGASYPTLPSITSRGAIRNLRLLWVVFCWYHSYQLFGMLSERMLLARLVGRAMFCVI